MLGNEKLPIERALREVPRYTDICRYMTQLAQYLPFVEEQNIKVVTSDRLKYERRATLHEIFSFIGVEPLDLPEAEVEYNVSARRGRLRRLPILRRLRRQVPNELSDELADELRALLAPEVAGLRRFIPDFDGWGIA
jgi:hypothetical protein